MFDVMFSESLSELDHQLSTSPLTESTYGVALESKRPRRENLRGNPGKTPCIKCGRVPHRRCENKLCPRCCNVVVKNCPVHIKKNDPRKGAASIKPLENSRNLTEATEAYLNVRASIYCAQGYNEICMVKELESVRRRYRWLYEKKRLADGEELQQSIKRYKDNAQWLSEIFQSSMPHSNDVDMEDSLWESRGEELFKRCDEVLKEEKVFPKESSTSVSDELTMKTRRVKKRGKKQVSRAASSSQWITSVVIPQNEWKLLLESISSGASQNL